jgi:hypothetical protein
LAVSRLAYIALFDELDVTARLYVPSFGNAAAERGISTHVPELTTDPTRVACSS